jgi:Na+/melibiose symporter-like transporter
MTKSANPKNVLLLGLVSMFNDIASEGTMRVLPFYLNGVLGASMATVGAVEGIASATATLLSPVFGVASDRLRKRKAFVLAGYSVSALGRALLAAAGLLFNVPRSIR